MSKKLKVNLGAVFAMLGGTRVVTKTKAQEKREAAGTEPRAWPVRSQHRQGDVVGASAKARAISNAQANLSRPRYRRLTTNTKKLRNQIRREFKRGEQAQVAA